MNPTGVGKLTFSTGETIDIFIKNCSVNINPNGSSWAGEDMEISLTGNVVPNQVHMLFTKMDPTIPIPPQKMDTDECFLPD